MELTCFQCGEVVESGEDHDCPTPSPVAAADGCPMCNQEYDEWMTHLTEECTGGQADEETATASVGDSDQEWEEEPLPLG